MGLDNRRPSDGELRRSGDLADVKVFVALGVSLCVLFEVGDPDGDPGGEWCGLLELLETLEDSRDLSLEWCWLSRLDVCDLVGAVCDFGSACSFGPTIGFGVEAACGFGRTDFGVVFDFCVACGFGSDSSCAAVAAWGSDCRSPPVS